MRRIAKHILHMTATQSARNSLSRLSETEENTSSPRASCAHTPPKVNTVAPPRPASNSVAPPPPPPAAPAPAPAPPRPASNLVAPPPPPATAALAHAQSQAQAIVPPPPPQPSGPSQRELELERKLEEMVRVIEKNESANTVNIFSHIEIPNYHLN